MTRTRTIPRDELNELMRRVARREQDAMAEFWDIALPKVRSLMRSTLSGSGITPSTDQLDDMARDGVVALLEMAPSWRPEGGALPWNWAAPRLRSIARESLGVFADDIDELVASHDGGRSKARGKELTCRLAARRMAEDLVRLGRHDDPADQLGRPEWLHQCSGNRDGLQVLADLAHRCPEVAALQEVLRDVASEKHASVFVDVIIEEAGGNPRAAVTVAQNHGIRTDNARQIRGRVARRIATAATSAPTVALAELPIVFELRDRRGSLRRTAT